MSLTPANEVTTRAVKIAIDYRVSQVIIRSRSIKQIMKRANSIPRYVVPPFLFYSPRFSSITTSFPLREKEIFDEIEWEGKSIQNFKQFSSKGNGKISIEDRTLRHLLQSSTTPSFFANCPSLRSRSRLDSTTIINHILKIIPLHQFFPWKKFSLALEAISTSRKKVYIFFFETLNESSKHFEKFF